MLKELKMGMVREKWKRKKGLHQTYRHKKQNEEKYSGGIKIRLDITSEFIPRNSRLFQHLKINGIHQFKGLTIKIHMVF